jgi:hypothetical protein
MQMATERGNHRVVETLRKFKVKAPWGEGRKGVRIWECEWVKAKERNYKYYGDSSDESEGHGDGAEGEGEEGGVGDEGESD